MSVEIKPSSSLSGFHRNIIFFFFVGQIHVVKDNRLYRSWNPEAPTNSETEINMVSGIHAAKAALNKLHHVLGGGGYNQV